MIELKLKGYKPTGDIYLLELSVSKIKDSDFDKSATGIFIQQSSVVDSREVTGTIKKMGPKCDYESYEVGDIIHYDITAGLDIVFEDESNKYILIGDEKFLGRITPKTETDS